MDMDDKILELVQSDIIDQKTNLSDLEFFSKKRKKKIKNKSLIEDYIKLKKNYIDNLYELMIHSNPNYLDELNDAIIWWNTITDEEIQQIINKHKFSGLVSSEAIHNLYKREKL